MVDSDVGGRYILTIRDDFSAAHALRNYHGKCENPHGHNFAVEVVVEGTRLDPETGMLLDFRTLKQLLKQVLADMDHCMLNEKPPFDRINPSSENMARHIWQKMRELLRECDDPQARETRLASVRVSEKNSQSATWLATD